MKNAIAAIIYVCAMAVVGCYAAEKTKLAEGEYGIVKSQTKVAVGKTIDEWTLWRLPDGRLQVEAKLPQWARERYRRVGTSVVQTFTFAKKMELVGYEVHAIGSDMRIDLFCELRPKVIRGREPKAGRAELQVGNATYSFGPGEFYGLDLAWFYASVIHSNTSPAFQTPIYWLELPDPDTKMEIVPKPPELIKYVGKEKITIMGKQLDANKYELGDQQCVVWTALNSGMVLAIEIRDEDAVSEIIGENVGKMELVQFKSYSPSFGRELK